MARKRGIAPVTPIRKEIEAEMVKRADNERRAQTALVAFQALMTELRVTPIIAVTMNNADGIRYEIAFRALE